MKRPAQTTRRQATQSGKKEQGRFGVTGTVLETDAEVLVAFAKAVLHVHQVERLEAADSSLRPRLDSELAKEAVVVLASSDPGLDVSKEAVVLASSDAG